MIFVLCSMFVSCFIVHNIMDYHKDYLRPYSENSYLNITYLQCIWLTIFCCPFVAHSMPKTFIIKLEGDSEKPKKCVRFLFVRKHKNKLQHSIQLHISFKTPNNPYGCVVVRMPVWLNTAIVLCAILAKPNRPTAQRNMQTFVAYIFFIVGWLVVDVSFYTLARKTVIDKPSKSQYDIKNLLLFFSFLLFLVGPTNNWNC